MRKEFKKVRNIAIGILTFVFLSNISYKLVKGKIGAKKIVANHLNTKDHFENIVAHRGFSGLNPDNSYQAILAALTSDCTDMIEIDIHMTADKRIVLYHDSFINLQDLVIRIEDLKLEELDKELVFKNYPIYNFEELLYDDTLFLFERYIQKTSGYEALILLENFTDWYPFSKPLILDVKTNNINYDMMKEIDRIIGNYKDCIFIQSDCYEFLVYMMELYPDYRYLYIINSKDDLKRLDKGFYGYTVKYSLLDRMTILDDKIYFVYTINSNRKYFNLLNNKNYSSNMYIITDNPDYICALSETKKLRK